LKSAADYGVDPLTMISLDQAKEVTAIARQFIEDIAEIIK